jgi:hypothetical protein
MTGESVKSWALAVFLALGGLALVAFLHSRFETHLAADSAILVLFGLGIAIAWKVTERRSKRSLSRRSKPDEKRDVPRSKVGRDS